MAEEIIESLKPEILRILEASGEITNSHELCQERGWDHELFVGALKSLHSKEMILADHEQRDCVRLTADGSSFLSLGSHEFRVFQAVPEEGIFKKDLEAAIGGGEAFSVGFMQCNKRKWLKLDKAGVDMKATGGRVLRAVEASQVGDDVADQLRAVAAGGTLAADVMADLKRRKLITPGKLTIFRLQKGPKFALKVVEHVTELTADMIASGSWKELEFKQINYNAKGLEPPRGRLHPLMKVRSLYRSIFLEMGFQEMLTNNYVESSFWNFDALFQPQQHPTRDAHDTFFLREPASALTLSDAQYVERVKASHEVGGDGSIGWRYPWKLAEAHRNILRTHTTSVSARMLYALGQQETFKPTRFFSIDRVFRNEKMDATHLAEFHQVEGLVADYDLTLGNLMGILRQFFAKLGINDIRFKPAFNPYTEPSMEIFGFHPVHKRWLELGNSGMFRPEMLLPMGLPENVRVIAWGLGLERPVMIRHCIDNIRTLVGAKVDLAGFVKTHPIVRDT